MMQAAVQSTAELLIHPIFGIPNGRIVQQYHFGSQGQYYASMTSGMKFVIL
jgi:hypothetical protein